MSITLAQEYKIVSGTTAVTTNGGVDADFISLKNAISVTIIAKLTQAVGHATVLAVNQATVVAGSDTKVLAKVVPIWSNADTSTTDTNSLQTRAVNFTVAADALNKVVMFKVLPADLDVENSFDCISLGVSDSSQATNLVDITYVIETNYPQDGPPTAITD